MMTIPSHTSNSVADIAQIKAALTIPNFGRKAAKLVMGMAGRLLDRPTDMAGAARVGAVLILLYPIDGMLHIAYEAA